MIRLRISNWRWQIVMCIAIAVGSSLSYSQTLTGVRFCIDPGHGGHDPANDRRIEPDPGIVFWESEGNFQKALRLDTLLQAQGAFVILTRYTNDYPNDADEPTLTQRWTLANANNVHWFHSIHSNAFNTVSNYTLVLLKEDIPSRQPAFPQALTMSQIISPKIRTFLRTTSSQVALDYTFYGGPNGGFNLGVLRGLVMPGELSEGSFHDVPAECRRLLNLSYNKMEAYALRNSFMQYYTVPADTLGIVAGIQTEVGVNRPINTTRVRLLPENRLYNGDAFNNGFYMFDRLTSGTKTIRFETPGYQTDSLVVNVGAGGLSFADKLLESNAAPAVITSLPVRNDTMFHPAQSIVINFSKTMVTGSVDSAFSIVPNVVGRKIWSNNNATLTFDPDSALALLTNFTLRVEGTARATNGQFLDGDGNGTPGDPFILPFRTRFADAIAPRIVTSTPGADAIGIAQNAVICVTFDEPLNPATVTIANFALGEIGGPTLTRTLQYWQSGSKSGVNMYATDGLQAGRSYRIRVSGVADLSGNVIPITSPILWQFSTAPAGYQFAAVDSFNTGLSNWMQPSGSGSTVGIDSAAFEFNTVNTLPVIPSNGGSSLLRFYWNPAASSWLIREYLSGGAPRNVTWRKERTVLQVFVHGDASGSQFRFAIDDSVDAFPGGRGENHEVSRWFTIDWVGWKLVEWDLENDSVGSWIGNGRLEGLLRFDSFQLRYLPGSSARTGQLYFDQLQIASKMPTSVSDPTGELPKEFALHQNYPNPFNPSTTISFSLPATGAVALRIFNLVGQEITTLVNGQLDAGTHTIQFDATGLSSGVYLYQLESGSKRLTQKMVLMR